MLRLTPDQAVQPGQRREIQLQPYAMRGYAQYNTIQYNTIQYTHVGVVSIDSQDT